MALALAGLALSGAACASERSTTPPGGGSDGDAARPGTTETRDAADRSIGASDGSGSSAGPTGGGARGGSSAGSNGASLLDGESGAGEAGGSGDTGDPADSGSPGGADATTGADGGSGGAALPALVTSAPNDYWNTSVPPTIVTSGTADLSVDASTTYQRWDGFGGAFNEMGWDALSVVPSEIPRAMKLLFDPQDGAAFVSGRIPLGASDYAMSQYTLDETAGDFAMADFSIARDQQMLIPFVQAALQVRPDLHLWASPWTPPLWMKDSAGRMKTDAQTLQAYALYFARFVEEYGKQGLTIEAVHPQNEPGYASVKWTQALYIDFIKTYLGPEFAARNLATEIWCGTMSAPSDGPIATTLASDPAAMKYVKGFGLQWNLQSTVSALTPEGPVMQTEHKCGNYNFATPYWDQSRYNPNMPQNDHAYGEESWQLIRDWIVAGVNSYAAWNMVLDTIGKSLSGWPQNALLVVDRSAKTLTATPAYYVFRHFSRYIDPGATRIGISGSSDALAFKNPDGAIIAEIYNKGDAQETTTVAVGPALYQFTVPGHGWATLRVAP